MKRTITTLSAFAAGAALLLAGCGSDTSGTTVPQAPAASQSPNAPTSAAPSIESTSAESTTGETSTGETSTGETSTGETSTGETSTGETSTGETSTGETSTKETSTDNTSATTTVGDGGNLDGTSVAWFETYCSGVSPALAEVKKFADVSTGGSSDPQATLKKLAPIFTTMGNAFTKTAKDLDGVPVPTFNGGDTLAANVSKAMNDIGPKFTEIGTALAKGDPAAMSKLSSIGSDIKGLQELSKFRVDAGTLAAIKQIPSCKPLFNAGR